MTTVALLWPLVLLLPAIFSPRIRGDSAVQQPLMLEDDQVKHQAGRLDFELRHIFHHGRNYPQVYRRFDVARDQHPETLLHSTDESRAHFSALSRPIRMQKLVDQRREHIESLQAQGRARGRPLELTDSEWTLDTVLGPNISDVETIASLARMTLNAYQTEPGAGEWQDVGPPFNFTDSFGWMTDGLRGHIFADATNDTVVIAIKGTSISLTGFPEGPTGSVEKDRINDNLLFSCCCGKGNLFVGAVCNCATSKSSCNSTCIEESLRRPNTYYTLAKELYYNVTELYPNANVWLTGHSLGGSIAALLGATVFRPAVTFEAPGEAMAAKRLGLPTPPEYQLGAASGESSFDKGAYHFGHTADPIFMGTCSGMPCSLEGFFLQSTCHSGHVCVWDVQKDLGWTRSIIHHRIITVINSLMPKYNSTPKCTIRQNCTDCSDWKFYESHQSDPATTSTTSITTTVTCTSPGWWGCLDPTSTSHVTSTSTSTCMTPGWFGCKDRTTSTSTTSTTTTTSESITLTTSTSTSITPTTTCETPGWFGCKDRTTSTSDSTVSTSTLPSTAAPTSTSTCRTPGWFGCKDRPTSTTNAATVASPQVVGSAFTAEPTLINESHGKTDI